METVKTLQYVLSANNSSTALPSLALQMYCKFEGKSSKLIPFTELFQLLNQLPLADQQLLKWLKFISQQQILHESSTNTLILEEEFGAEILSALLSSQRCYWLSTQNPPLSLGDPREARLEWQMLEDGLKKMKFQLSGRPGIIFKLKPFWYLDQRSWQCGLVSIDLAPEVVNKLLAAPSMSDQQIKMLQEVLGKPHNSSSRKSSSPVPVVKEMVPQLNLCLVPILVENPYEIEKKLTLKIPAVELSFHYESADFPREEAKETEAREFLRKQGLVPFESTHFMLAKPTSKNYFVLVAEGALAWLDFNLKKLPLFKQKNWQILTSADYPYRVIDQEDIEWYAQLEELSSHKWFDVELGINVQGEKINLLPLIVTALENFFAEHAHEEDKAALEDGHLLTKLPDGRLLPIPISRIKPILNVLTELFDRHNLNAHGKIRLSKIRAAQLLAINNEIQEKLKMRWWGVKKLESLAQRLQSFNQIELVSPPKGLNITLRHYQQEGLSWLQFLREYHLAGILADDMGLGKTIQTLAHIMLEKEAGRLTKPCLVVMPTTLVTNWFLEAQKFCPDLRVLMLHGAARQELFDKIESYDLVLTSYPLIVRDAAVLEKKSFYLLVLDEAQLIKNARSKAALFINKLTAEYRLCLTGTPLENHLGELWSLFNFLMPGFLGDSKQFSRLFRTPIEKHHNADSRQALRGRVSPFMLRRTKESVALELPAKNEIIQTIELETTQRDLYESVRLSLHESIQQAIEKRGLANSQIIILDALLKLRQICCDPRLLKLESTLKAEAKSAKLEYLCEILPDLIAEGRHILLFSQFTEMLALIEAEVNQLNIPYVKLTGQTQDRLTPINAFQNGETPLFLISLKAGGLGLNLTSADAVIHYDPWWNPAVERQATDRAHRIGQDKSVFVYKLIMAGTIEEKILALQQRKKALLDIFQVDEHIEHKQISLNDLQLIVDYL